MLVDPKPKGAELYAWHIENKLVAPDEARDRLGLPALPGGAGGIDQLAADRLAGADKPGALAKVEAATPAPAAAPEEGDAGPVAGPVTQPSAKPAA